MVLVTKVTVARWTFDATGHTLSVVSLTLAVTLALLITYNSTGNKNDHSKMEFSWYWPHAPCPTF